MIDIILTIHSLGSRKVPPSHSVPGWLEKEANDVNNVDAMQNLCGANARDVWKC